jgi:hypothetical protein
MCLGVRGLGLRAGLKKVTSALTCNFLHLFGVASGGVTMSADTGLINEIEHRQHREGSRPGARHTLSIS